MADTYVASGAQSAFADISAFVADGNAINAATKTALNTALTNISNLLGSYNNTTRVVVSAAHPDFNHIPPATRAKLQNEITALQTAITNHA